jgi:hypothetical protein
MVSLTVEDEERGLQNNLQSFEHILDFNRESRKLA